MAFLNLGSICTKKDGAGTYLRIQNDKLQGLMQAIKKTGVEGNDFFLNIDLFTNNLKAALAQGKLDVKRSEGRQEVVNKIESKPEQAFVVGDVSVTLKD